jgi:hypothetical protein
MSKTFENLSKSLEEANKRHDNLLAQMAATNKAVQERMNKMDDRIMVILNTLAQGQGSATQNPVVPVYPSDDPDDPGDGSSTPPIENTPFGPPFNPTNGNHCPAKGKARRSFPFQRLNHSIRNYL